MIALAFLVCVMMIASCVGDSDIVGVGDSS